MTKIELLDRIEILEIVNSDMDTALAVALKKIRGLENELAFVRGVFAREQEDIDGGFYLDGVEDIERALAEQKTDEDGEIFKDGLKMLIRSGMGVKDIQELVAKGDEILKWLEKKGIKLDSGGDLTEN